MARCCVAVEPLCCFAVNLSYARELMDAELVDKQMMGDEGVVMQLAALLCVCACAGKKEGG